jgi:D-serine deaminase-like pyridoxal phosphate-dependent protein
VTFDPHDDVVDGTFKGFAPSTHGRRLGDLLGESHHLFDGTFSPPLMILRSAALAHNIATMAAWCVAQGVDLAPHGKTTLAPQLFQRQLRAGAWAITVATPAQVVLCRSAGIPRVLLANELLDPAVIRWVLDELASDPAFDFLCYIDSLEGVRRLEQGIRESGGRGRPLDVLVEVGFTGGRSGCRTLDDARAVAQAASRVPGLRLVGVAGYEGLIGHELTDDVLGLVRDFLGFLQACAAQLAGDGLIVDRGDGIILSAGGSVFFDEVVAVLGQPLAGGLASRVVVRSGAYISHDSGLYERLSPFSRPGRDEAFTLLPALEAWGEVLSTPEPGLAIVGLGRRDVPTDQGLPVPLMARRSGGEVALDARASRVTGLNDQHAYIAVPPEVDLRVGDWLSVGISHPCTAFDKWRIIPEVDNSDRLVDFIRTWF